MPVKQQPRSALSQGSWRSILCRGSGAQQPPQEPAVLTSEAGPLSAPGQEKVTNSWHLLCTTKQQTAKRTQGQGQGHHERREVTQQSTAVSDSERSQEGFEANLSRRFLSFMEYPPPRAGIFGKTQQNKVLCERQSRAGNTSVALSSLSLVAHALRSAPGTERGRIWRSRESELKSACGQKWKIVPKGTGGQFSSHSSAFLQHLPSLRLPDQKTRTSSSPHTRQCQPCPSGNGTGRSIPTCHCRIPCRVSRANPPSPKPPNPFSTCQPEAASTVSAVCAAKALHFKAGFFPPIATYAL